MNDTTKKRIINGINFFREYAGPNYDTEIFKRFFPTFLKLVEHYLTDPQQTPIPETDPLVLQAETIFKTKAV